MVQWRGWERGLRALLGWGILVCIIIFFLPLVTLLQQVINLDQLASQGGVSWAASISNVPFIGRAHPCSFHDFDIPPYRFEFKLKLH